MLAANNGWSMVPQWILALTAVVSAIFIYFQIQAAKKQLEAVRKSFQAERSTFNYNADWREKEKASDLAGRFESTILPKIQYVNAVVSETDYKNQLKAIENKKPVEFTKDEMDRELGANFLNDVTDQLSGLDDDVYIEARKSLLLREIANIPESVCSDASYSYYRDEFEPVSRSLLNQLEHFSMYFNCDIADEGVVYQSLHQVYLLTVESLYPQICMRNTHPPSRYYTHIRDLYVTWVEKREKIEESSKESAKKAVDKGSHTKVKRSHEE